MICRVRFVLAVVAAVLGSACWAAQASAYVYWSDWGNSPIARANTDGSGVDQSFLTGGNGPGLAVDGQHIYWPNTASNTIARANLDGTNADQNFITGATGPYDVAVDGQHVYWTNSGSIGRANLDGSNVNQSFITATGPTGVAVDGQHVYWTNYNGNTVGRANLDGTGVDENFITGADGPEAVAVDGQHIYWTNYDENMIGRATLDGSNVDQSFITGANSPWEVALDGQYLYWTNNATSTIGRANLDGTGVNESFIINANNPIGLAVDGGPTGTGTASATSLSFATQPLDTLSAPQRLTVTNTGIATLRVTRARVTTGAIDDFLISADTCSGVSLQVGAACTIDVRFDPGSTGERTATLTVTSNDTSGPLQIALSGTGGQLPQGPPGTNGPNGPVNTTPPTISGSAKAGKMLSCSTGRWSNDPTRFSYRWSRQGTPIFGATTRRYKVKSGDEGLTLTCTVMAYNAAGSGQASTSRGVAVPFVARCPRATGHLAGQVLGQLRLGMTRAQARRAYPLSSSWAKRNQDFFCLTPIGVRVEYASSAIAATLSRSARRAVRGRVVLALTANAYYALDGVRPGATLNAARRALGVGNLFHIGINWWYFVGHGSWTAVLKVHHGIVAEIGIANGRLTTTHSAQLRFIRHSR